MDVLLMVNPYIEKRKFGRRVTFKPAVLLTEDGQRITGTVVDISEGGARFQTLDTSVVPKQFTLEIAGDDFCVKCQLIHRLPDAVGMQFIASPRKISWGPAQRRHFATGRDGE